MSDAGEDFAELGVRGAAFDPQGALADRVVHVRGGDVFLDAVGELEAFEACNGEYQGVEFPLVEFAKACFHISSGFGEDEVGSGVQELCATAEAAGADAGTLGEFFPSEIGRGGGGEDEGIGGFGPLGDGGQGEMRMRIGREILQAVNGQIGKIGEDGVLNFPGEDSHAAETAERAGEVAVADGGDVEEFHITFRGGGAQEAGDVFGLPEREAAGTGRDFEKSAVGGRGHVRNSGAVEEPARIRDHQ